MQFGRGDISWGNLYATPYRRTFMDFTDWYILEHFTAVVPKPPYYPKILALLRPFDRETWLGLVVLLLSVIGGFALSKLVHQERLVQPSFL